MSPSGFDTTPQSCLCTVLCINGPHVPRILAGLGFEIVLQIASNVALDALSPLRKAGTYTTDNVMLMHGIGSIVNRVCQIDVLQLATSKQEARRCVTPVEQIFRRTIHAYQPRRCQTEASVGTPSFVQGRSYNDNCENVFIALSQGKRAEAMLWYWPATRPLEP